MSNLGNNNVKKKYEFTGEILEFRGHILHQIKYLKDIEKNDIDFGTPSTICCENFVGGWIEKEENLSQTDNSYIDNSCIVMGNSILSGDVEIYSGSIIENSVVTGTTRLYNCDIVNCKISDGYFTSCDKEKKLEMNNVESLSDITYIDVSDGGKMEFVKLLESSIDAPSINITSSSKNYIKLSGTFQSDDPIYIEV